MDSPSDAPAWSGGLAQCLLRWRSRLDLLAWQCGYPGAMILEGPQAPQAPPAHDPPPEGGDIAGQTQLLMCHSLPIRRSDGPPVGQLCLMDLAPRPPDEMALRLLGFWRDSLETELALLQSRIALADTHKARTQGLGRIGHELRTPLSAIMGFAQLLEVDRAHTLSARQRQQVQHIHQAGGHAMSLLGDMLDLACAETGQLRARLQDTSLKDIVEAVVTLSRDQAAQRGVQLRAPAPRGPDCYARTDPTRLRQVLLNLLSNAIKYNRPGGFVAVELQDHDERLHIIVRDSGLGMTGEQLAHLFEPFNRLGREHSGIAGQGIGMALTQQLVQLLHAEIEVHSHAGQGTEVCVSLPAAQRGQAPSPQDCPAPVRRKSRPAAQSFGLR